MQRKFIYGLILLLSILIISCSPKQSEIIVAEYGNYEITMNDFENAYAKNVGSLEKAKKDSLKDLEKFLDLYVNFKMKLRDAKVRGLDKDPSTINEIKGYEKTIGSSYLLEKELYEKGVRDLYDKRSEELRVSHLLIRTDTLTDEEAKQKALDIIKRVQNGAKFEDEVRKYSDDRFSKDKGGDIYYITAGSIIPSFEDLAYETPVGSVNPTPLKTKYGYHIIKVTDRRKRIPQVRASHILIRRENAEGKADEKSRLELAKEVLEKAKAGEDFGKLATEYSEDPGSKNKKGDLGYFSRRQMVQPFDEAVFNLKVGEISDIVETKFGFHIIKLTDKKEYPSFDKERKTLRDLYEKTRKKRDYEKLIEKYSNDINLVMHDENLKGLTTALDSTILREQYFESELNKTQGSTTLFTIGNVKYTLDSLITYGINDVNSKGKVLTEKVLKNLLKKYKEEKILEAKAGSLINTDPEFAKLMNEYKNVIYIFKLQEKEVWNKMKLDSAAIYALYEKTKDNYKLPDRVQFNEIFSKSDSLINSYYTMLQNGADFDSIATKYSERRRSVLKNFKSKLNKVGYSVIAKAAFELENAGDYSEVMKNENGWSIVKLIKKEPARLKTFEEARAEVTSAYQDIESSELENAYISRLKKIYHPKLFYEELDKAYKN